MAMKQPGRTTHRTAQGRMIDMDMLRKKNELTPAVGNARVNARGDELGPGGKIIRKREDIVNEYYKNTNVVSGKSTAVESAPQNKSDAPEPKKKKAAKNTKEQAPTASEVEEWEENEDGDFIKKGK